MVVSGGGLYQRWYTPPTKIVWFLIVCAPLDCRGAADNGILIRCSRRLYYIAIDDLYCRLTVVGQHTDEFEAAVAIATCRQCKFNFRWCIITKCRINLGYSEHLVLITYNLLVYYITNRLASPEFPSLSSTAVIALVLWSHRQICANFALFSYKN